MIERDHPNISSLWSFFFSWKENRRDSALTRVAVDVCDYSSKYETDKGNQKRDNPQEQAYSELLDVGCSNCRLPARTLVKAPMATKKTAKIAVPMKPTLKSKTIRLIEMSTVFLALAVRGGDDRDFDWSWHPTLRDTTMVKQSFIGVFQQKSAPYSGCSMIATMTFRTVASQSRHNPMASPSRNL